MGRKAVDNGREFGRFRTIWRVDSVLVRTEGGGRLLLVVGPRSVEREVAGRWGAWGGGLDAEGVEDGADHRGVGDERDDATSSVAVGALEHVEFEERAAAPAARRIDLDRLAPTGPPRLLRP